VVGVNSRSVYEAYCFASPLLTTKPVPTATTTGRIRLIFRRQRNRRYWLSDPVGAADEDG
jgi:hypothetical protein